jgi:hypothetical protein
MKKIFLLASVFILSTFVFAKEESINVFEVKGGYDLSSSSKFEDNPYSDQDLDKLVKNGFHFGLEFRREVFKNFQIGTGIDYRISKIKQPNNRVENSVNYVHDTGSLISVPVYITARYNFRNSTEFTPYIKINAGYSTNSADFNVKLKDTNTGKVIVNYDVNMKDGIYYGLGLGVEYRNFLVDLTYDISHTKIQQKMDNLPYDKDYSDHYSFDIKKLILSVGYQLEY